MRLRSWARAAIACALVPPLLVLQTGGTANAEPKPGRSASKVSPAQRVTGTKALTSRLAKTDPALLNRSDSTAVSIVVKLDYDSIATYTGGLPGLKATSPSKTGKDLSGAADETRYEDHVLSIENSFVREFTKRIPNARVGQRLRTVYGGVAASVPANRIGDILSIKGVVAVQADAMRKPLTDSSPSFIGATELYPRLGGTRNAGFGVIFGVLDTGAWPEHPSFGDQGNLNVPPPKADGTPRACNFGDNPTTPANDVFRCNNKLIGGAPFLNAYLSDPNRAAAEPFHTARDSNGHGTHTGSTSAGNALASAPVFGVERGPINGIAPGAWVSAYKVCGIQGCVSSDSAAAVQQAIRDGVKVINFSISGGTNPFTDPVELAFRDAYQAGVLVSASAGNDGPEAGTANHLSPWVMTVAASTQRREFRSTLKITGSDGATVTLTGASITAGAGPAPVVLSSAAPYNNRFCGAPAPAGTFTGKIVACERGGTNSAGGIARVEKGFNVRAGGAIGMILYNPALADVETDNHWLPTVHLADGTSFLAFVGAHPGVTASFTAGQKVNGQGDVMAAFSSRGPAGMFIKPDVTAPGVQILAANTPVREDPTGGPPGEMFQAIAGTSMSSPHNAGAAILLKARNPTWTPGQIKSALMTTATTRVVKEDTTTPADPFDIGAGRIRVDMAANPGLTFDETAIRMAALGGDPVNAVHLNIPSINAPVMPGSLTTARTAKNVTSRAQTYDVHATAPAGSSITVNLNRFTLNPGREVQLQFTIRSRTATGQQFGQVQLVPRGVDLPTLHLPVAWVPRQGDISLTSSCTPSTINVLTSSTCTIAATNKSFGDTTADLATTTSANLPIAVANGAQLVDPFNAVKPAVTLTGAQPGIPSIANGALFGYIPLAEFGIAPDPIGDEALFNYSTPAFVYGGQSYTTVGVDSNGYLVVGGGTVEDNECCNLTQIPDPARPNNILAPFWTDLDGSGAPGVTVARLADGPNSWLVVEWQVNVFGTTSNRHFQVWIGLNGTQDITFAYDPAALPADPNGMKFLVGAENVNGSGGAQLPAGVLPTADQRVTSSPPTPGGTASYTLVVLGLRRGVGTVTTSMETPAVPGTTIVTSTVTVQRPGPRPV